MKIEQFDRESKGFFKATEDDTESALHGKEAGRMTYSWAGEDRFIIDHTEVNPEFSGKGVGQKMVEAALTFAREKNLKIIPLCPFAKAQFDRHADWQDVLIEKH